MTIVLIAQHWSFSALFNVASTSNSASNAPVVQSMVGLPPPATHLPMPPLIEESPSS